MAAGCIAPRAKLVISDPDPSVKIPAIKKAARKEDRSQVAALVKELDSDDPAIRFYSIRALHRLTGESFNYRYFDSDDDRKPAVERWKNWLVEKDNGAARPGVEEATVK